MPGKTLATGHRIADALAAGRTAMEESRFEDAATQFRAALRMAPGTGDEEALIRCDLSEALEKRALNREQLDAVAKYENSNELSKLSEQTQMLVLIRLGWSMSV